jgi:hypothetical protein
VRSHNKSSQNAASQQGGPYYDRRVTAPPDKAPNLPRVDAFVITGGLLLMAALGLSSMRGSSATSDEVTHLPAGYTYLVTGDHRLNPQHPPLVKMLAALPLLALQPELDLEDPGWTSDPVEEWGFGHRFLYGNDADQLLLWGRVPVLVLGLLLGLYVFFWSRSLWGTRGAALALLLYATCPVVLAHSGLVTMDVGLALFWTATLFHLRTYLRGGAYRHLGVAGIALGCTLAAKFSGVFILPVIAVLLLAWVLRPFDDSGRRGTDVTPGRRFGKTVAVGLAMGATAALVIWACYGFTRDVSVYLDGLLRVNADHADDYFFYALGRFEQGGFWWYFLVAFLAKTRLMVLVLLGAAGGLALFGRKRAGDGMEELWLVLPPLLFAGVTSALAANIGVRYLLPCYPLLFVFIGRAAPALWPQGLLRALLLLFVARAMLSTAVSHPHHLSYFSDMVGGSTRGPAILDDSNIDWGQDLRRLKTELDRRGIERVHLRYAWTVSADPAWYGIDYEHLTDEQWSAAEPAPGFYAIGTQELIRGKLYEQQHGVATDWLARHEPAGRVGYSFYLFHFE